MLVFSNCNVGSFRFWSGARSADQSIMCALHNQKWNLVAQSPQSASKRVLLGLQLRRAAQAQKAQRQAPMACHSVQRQLVLEVAYQKLQLRHLHELLTVLVH